MSWQAIRSSCRYLLLFSSLGSTTALAQLQWGGVQGVVSDLTGSVIPGAYVNISGASLPRGLSGTTDPRGRYLFPALPGGRYTVSVSAPGFHTLRYHNLDVRLGSQMTFNARLTLGAVTESVEVNESVQALDIASSRTLTSITASEFDNLARGHSFHTLLMMAPGVRNEVKAGALGVGGLTVDGASGAENTYYIDGVEVSDVLTGALRPQNSVPFEFLQGVEIQNGGFEAEFGGATGGVISAATRSGTNQFHGELLFAANFGLWNASDRGYWQRSATNPNIAEYMRPRKDDYRILYPGISLGGPLWRNRVFNYLSYMPEFERSVRTIDYPAGPESFTNTRTRHYLLERIDASPLPKLQFNASWVWSPGRKNGALPVRDPRVPVPSGFSDYREFIPAQTLSLAGTWTPVSSTVVSARYGYKYTNGRTNAYGVAPAAPWAVYMTPSSVVPGVPANLSGNTGYQTSSASYSVDRDITTRTSLYIDASHVRTIAGQQHVLKGGYTLNRIFNDVSDGYPHGHFEIYWGDSFSRGSVLNETGRYGYYLWQDGPRTFSRATGYNHAFYVQDTWRVLPSLTINVGVRMEHEYLPPYSPEYQGMRIANPVEFGWGDKIAPRLGAAWDVRGDGRWKLSGTWGLFYDLMKYNLARTAFGGVRWFSHAYRLDDPNVLSLSLKNPGALGSEITFWNNRAMPVNSSGQWQGIDPNLRPFTSAEMSVSLERRLSSHLRFSARYVRKDLLRTVEDIGILDSSENEVYLIGNPGYGVTRAAGSPYGARTPNGLEYQVPRATRRYHGLELRLDGTVHRYHLLASWTLSRLWGNFAGLANSDEAGRMDPGLSRSFDLPTYYFDSSGSQRNVEGRLATDRPHVLKLFGWREMRTRAGSTVLGLSQQAMSGTPDSTTVSYLSAPTFPYGRGDMGRLPFFTQTDFNVVHAIRLSERFNIKLEGTATNLLNQAAVSSRVTQINRSGNLSSAQLPLSKFFGGWKLSDFVYPGSTTPAWNPIYGLPGADPLDGGVAYHSGRNDYSSAFLAQNPQFGAYQGPRSLRFGLRLVF